MLAPLINWRRSVVEALFLEVSLVFFDMFSRGEVTFLLLFISVKGYPILVRAPGTNRIE